MKATRFQIQTLAKWMHEVARDNPLEQYICPKRKRLPDWEKSDRFHQERMRSIAEKLLDHTPKLVRLAAQDYRGAR